jgi:hypothetical protein
VTRTILVRDKNNFGTGPETALKKIKENILIVISPSVQVGDLSITHCQQ